MQDLSEFLTRKKKIDVFLAEQGWNVQDRSKVIPEVDTKQSNFVEKRYATVSETLKNDLESKYADYLLLDNYGAPLAIIEAKRTTKDPILGQRQAEEYANDIKSQTGKDVFIFLSNGYEILFWDRERYPPRQIKGFYSRKDLERLRFQITSATEHSNLGVNPEIVNRPRSIECVKRVVEHLHTGKRKALIVMATGTGKTRVAMGIIDILMREKRAQKVLFLADRRALRDQAKDDGFKRFFPHEAFEVISGGSFDRNKRLYVSTIQTFQELYLKKDMQGQYIISPGEFDVVISDEAHRSIYNKWKDLFTYLDAIQIGLTATPAELLERDTFRFFNCTDGRPTAMYSYDEAVADGILCDFLAHIKGAKTHFQLNGVRPADLPESERARLIEQGIDPDEIDFEGTELEKKVSVKGTSEAIIREFMENCQTDETGTRPAKSILFAMTKKHARALLDAFELLYPEYKGTLARIIVSEDQRADALIKAFKNEPEIRIAISVDMLDTGIDIPEVCNLVFAKPVFSKIKFWQMLGRGTRSESACFHREWLPDGKKEFFVVFDFWGNFEYWKMNPEGVETKPVEAVTSRIFLQRLKQLTLLLERGDQGLVEQVKARIRADIDSLPSDSVSVREHAREIEKVTSPNFYDNVGINPVEYLTRNIMPLMKHQQDVNLQTATFNLRCEQLAFAVLSGNRGEVERLKPLIGEMVNNLPTSIDSVMAKKPLIDRVLSASFWTTVTYEDTRQMIATLGPLMPMMRPEHYEPIVIDMGDQIEQRTLWNWALAEGEQAYVTKYHEQVEKRILELADRNPVLMKVRNGEDLTEEDIDALEKAVLDPSLIPETPRGGHLLPRDRGLLISFLKSIISRVAGPDPETRIKDAFQTFMIENNKHYSADQLNFIRTIESVFAKNHRLAEEDLWGPPFSNFGTDAPVPMFPEADLAAFVGICRRLEHELFARAEA